MESVPGQSDLVTYLALSARAVHDPGLAQFLGFCAEHLYSQPRPERARVLRRDVRRLLSDLRQSARDGLMTPDEDVTLEISAVAREMLFRAWCLRRGNVEPVRLATAKPIAAPVLPRAWQLSLGW